MALLGALVARPQPVDDPTAVEVVRRQLDANAVARVHANAEPAHLAGGVPEGLVAVVELDPEHAVPERLDDLTGHLDLVFLLRYLNLLRKRILGRRAARRPKTLPTRSGSRSLPAGPSPPAEPRTPPLRLRRASGSPHPELRCSGRTGP